MESGDTLLHWAAKKGHLSLCKLIIKNVQDKNPKGKNGQTPLHVAALNGHTGKSFSVALIFASTNPQYGNRLLMEF